MYSSTLSLTSALDGGGWSTPHTSRFVPGKEPVPITYEAGWVQGPVWTGAKNLASTEIRSPEPPARSASLYRLSNLTFLVYCHYTINGPPRMIKSHMCRDENQLDTTEWFIALIICSTCFGHLYAHHQELETILVLLPHMVCNALVAGGRRSGAVQQAMRPGWGKLLEQHSLQPGHYSSLTAPKL